MAQDAGAGVGSDLAPAAPGNAATSGATTTTSSPCPNPDIATPGTAAVASVAATAALASSSAVHSPPSKPISPSQSPSVPAELTISTTPTTTTAATLPSPTAGPAPASSIDSKPAVLTSLSPSKLPATLAAAPAPAPASASASPSQQNGRSEASEADSDMNSYRPVLTAHNGLPVSYSTTTAAVSTSSHLAAASPPVTSGYASPTGISTVQYPSYPTSTTVSHPSESYRVSPVPSGNTLSLPSMRTIDSLPQQRPGQPQMPHHAMSISMNPSLTSTSSGPTIYPPHHTMSVPSNYGLPSDSVPRYPLPHDPRILGSRGPKKVCL